MLKLIHFILILTIIYTVAANVALRAAAVKGELKCGKNSAENVYVRLLRTFPDAKAKEEQIAKEVLESRTTGPSGLFEMHGNTNGRAVNETTLEPVIAIYHQCDDAKDTKGFRRFMIKVPTSYVSLGKMAKKTYDVGTLNLEIKYPDEKRDKDFKPK